MAYNRNLYDYLPPITADKDNFKALMSTENIEIKLLWEKLEKLKNEGYVISAEDIGLERLEKICQLTGEKLTIEERRLAIIIKLMGDRPYTMSTIYDRLVKLCGKSDGSITYGRDLIFEYGKEPYTLTVGIGVKRKALISEVKNMLLKCVPANIGINAYVIYNTHLSLKGLTHGEMRAYTHKQLYDDYVGV